MLAAELARVEAHEELPPLDVVRFQLPPPTSTPATEEEWKAALKNAKAQLEHQRIRRVFFIKISHQLTLMINRHTNLALLQTYGSNAWRIHNYLLEHVAKQAEQSLEDLKQLTVDVNRERKNYQV